MGQRFKVQSRKAFIGMQTQYSGADQSAAFGSLVAAQQRRPTSEPGFLCRLSLGHGQCTLPRQMRNDPPPNLAGKVRVSVIGTGSLGKEHVRIYSELAAAKEVDFVGIHDLA